MKVYKNNLEGFKEIRTKMLFIMIPVLLIMLIGGLWSNLIELGNGEIHATSFVPAILIVGIFVFTITRGLAKQRKMFKSYLLIIKDDVIEREQIMTPTISLTKDMITEIVKHKNGNILIKGQTRQDVIIVSTHIANREALESDLRSFMEIKEHPGKSILEKIGTLLLAPALLGLMAAIVFSSNKYVVLISTVLVTVTFAWSIHEVYTNKNIDDKSKRSIWGMAIAILVFIAIAYVKVVG